MSINKPKIEIQKNWIEGFCKSHNIIKLALFGSVLTSHFSTEPPNMYKCYIWEYFKQYPNLPKAAFATFGMRT